MWVFYPKRANFTLAHRPEFVLDTDWLFLVAGLVRWTWEARPSRLFQKRSVCRLILGTSQLTAGGIKDAFSAKAARRYQAGHVR